jgi:hypothetical protein
MATADEAGPEEALKIDRPLFTTFTVKVTGVT